MTLSPDPHGAAELRVEDVMTPAPVQLHVDCSVAGALAFLVRHRYQTSPVIDGDGQLVGLVTRAGLLAKVCQLSASPEPDALRDLMSAPIASLLERPLRVAAGTTLVDACRLLVCEEAPAVLIVRDGQLAGILTLQDVARGVAYGGASAPAIGPGRGHCFSPGGLPDAQAAQDARERERLSGLLESEPWAPPP